VTKSEKLMFRGASKSLRKMLTDLRKRKGETKPFMMLGMVARPDFVVLCNGQRVKYEGP